MNNLIKFLLDNVDKEELLNELKKDKDFNKIMEALSDTLGYDVPKIYIELKPEDEDHCSQLINIEGSPRSILMAMANIMAEIMIKLDEDNILREDACENFGKTIKECMKEIKNNKSEEE